MLCVCVSTPLLNTHSYTYIMYIKVCSIMCRLLYFILIFGVITSVAFTINVNLNNLKENGHLNKIVGDCDQIINWLTVVHWPRKKAIISEFIWTAETAAAK